MGLSKKQKQDIETLLKENLRHKFSNYNRSQLQCLFILDC